MKYAFHPTDYFSARLEKIRKTDPAGHDRIQGVIDRLLVYPEDADGKMQGVHHGKLKKYVGRRDYRLIYYWCELCRKANRRLEKTCSNCDKIADGSVIFFDVYHKNEMKKLKP